MAAAHFLGRRGLRVGWADVTVHARGRANATALLWATTPGTGSWVWWKLDMQHACCN